LISVSRAIGAFTGASFIGSLTQVLKGKITTVLLGAEGIGVLDQLMRVSSTLSLASTMGTYAGVIRHMAEYRRDEDRGAMRAHFASTAIVVITLSFTFALLGVLVAAWLSDLMFADKGARKGLVALAMLTVPLASVGWCYRVALNAAQDVRALVRSRIIADVTSVFALALLAWTFGLWGAVLGYIALHLVFLVSAWVYAQRLSTENRIALAPGLVQWTELRRNLGYGATGLISTFAQVMAALFVARWIIVEQDLAANGLYAMALKVSSVYLGGLSAAAAGYVLPALSAASNQSEFDDVLNDAMANGLIIVAPIAAGIMLSGEVLMQVLFSAEFVPAAFLLLIMLPGDLFRLASENIEFALSARKRLWELILLRVGWSLTYASVAVLAFSRFGLAGAAAAYLLAHALRLVVVVPMAVNGTGWRPGARIFRLGIAGLVLLAIVAGTVTQLPIWPLRLTVGAAVLAIWCWVIRNDPLTQKALRRLKVAKD